jgi:iron complex outermembrane receptor protein
LKNSFNNFQRSISLPAYGFFFLPGVAALFKFSPALSSRLGGGLGYKAPRLLVEKFSNTLKARLYFRPGSQGKISL